MPLPQLIAISGRKGTGKSALVKELLAHGRQRVSMADPAKGYLAKLYNWDLASLYDEKGKEEILPEPVVWNAEMAKRLVDIAKIDTSSKPLNDRPTSFPRRREAMQYLLTEVMRGHDPEFHTKRLLARIQDGGLYAIDDMRFPNELAMVRAAGHLAVYLVRPYNWKDISLHISETALRRWDFDYVLLSHRSLKYIIRQWRAFLEHFEQPASCPVRRDHLAALFKAALQNPRDVARSTSYPPTHIARWARQHLIHWFDHDGSRHDAISHGARAAFWGGVLAGAGEVLDASQLPTGSGSRSFGWRTAVRLCHRHPTVVHGLRRHLGTRHNVLYHSTGQHRTSLTFTSPWVQDDLKYWGLDRNPASQRKVPPLTDEDAPFWAAGILSACGGRYDRNGAYRWEVQASPAIIEWLAQRWTGGCVVPLEDGRMQYQRPFKESLAVPEAVATWPLDARPCQID